MYCNQCGSRLSGGEMHCTHCGKAVNPSGIPAGAPTASAPSYVTSAQGRVARHRTILGVLWLVRATMVLFPGMALMGISQFHRWPWPPGLGGLFVPFLGGLGFGFFLLAICEYATGIGLLMLQSWARLLAIIVGVVELIAIPFGTALGIYTLWVLLPQISESEYQQMARSHAMSQM